MAMRHPKATVLSGALSALFVMTVSWKLLVCIFIVGKIIVLQRVLSNCCDFSELSLDTFYWTW